MGVPDCEIDLPDDETCEHGHVKPCSLCQLDKWEHDDEAKREEGRDG